MVPLKLSLLSVFLFVLLFNVGNCKDDKDQVHQKDDSKKKTEQESTSDGENYDEIGEAFLSLLSDNLKMKIIKNKAANEGLVDPKQFKREPLTKEELEEVQAALVTAMQPIFGQFVNELAQGKDSEEENPELAIDGPAEVDKENVEDKVEGEESKEAINKKSDDKKETTTKKGDKKKEKRDEEVKHKNTEKASKQPGVKVESKPEKEEITTEEAKKDKKKKMSDKKGEKKAEASDKAKKKEQKDAKRKEEL